MVQLIHRSYFTITNNVPRTTILIESMMKVNRTSICKPFLDGELTKGTRRANSVKVKSVDMSVLIPVYINSRTTVYIKPGQDAGAVRKRYEQQHADTLRNLVVGRP